MALSNQILRVLACPACRGALSEAGDHLLCPACSLRFPVRDGIPVLLLSEAEKLGSDSR